MIVVAIIAVLVAISIPIFNSQLEKAREATDAANIRSIYAQLSADVLTEHETTDSVDGAATYSVTKNTNTGVYTGTATYVMTQKTDGTQSGDNIIIGGVTINSADFKTGTCTITVNGDGTAPTIAWA